MMMMMMMMMCVVFATDKLVARCRVMKLDNTSSSCEEFIDSFAIKVSAHMRRIFCVIVCGGGYCFSIGDGKNERVRRVD